MSHSNYVQRLNLPTPYPLWLAVPFPLWGRAFSMLAGEQGIAQVMKEAAKPLAKEWSQVRRREEAREEGKTMMGDAKRQQRMSMKMRKEIARRVVVSRCEIVGEEEGDDEVEFI
eukprot:754694-Hanusia_phi.AAC.6